MRTTTVQRTTNETSITINLALDGSGKTDIDTSIPFFDHMLSHIGRHGFFDLSIKAVGDTDIDYHHTVEDVGICLGTAFRQLIGDMKGIRRFGTARIPLNEALSEVTVDLCGRMYLVFNTELPSGKVGDFDIELAEEFFHGFADACKATVHVNAIYGRNAHHILETIFKSFGIALSEAVVLDKRIKEVRSTKGTVRGK